MDGFTLLTAFYFIKRFAPIETMAIAIDSKGFLSIPVSTTDSNIMNKIFTESQLATPVQTFDIDFNTKIATIVLEVTKHEA